MDELLDAVNTRWPRDFADVEWDAFDRAFRILAVSSASGTDTTVTRIIGYASPMCVCRNVASENSLHRFLGRRMCVGRRSCHRLAATGNEGVAARIRLSEYVADCRETNGAGPWRASSGARSTSARSGTRRAREPSILIDGKPLPTHVRYQGPRYWYDFLGIRRGVSFRFVPDRAAKSGR